MLSNIIKDSQKDNNRFEIKYRTINYSVNYLDYSMTFFI